MTTELDGPADPAGTPPAAASALAGFVAATTKLVRRLCLLADDVHTTEPGTAAVIEAFAELMAGQALDVISQWPT